MLKNIPLIIVLTASLTACGGSDSGGGNKSSSSVAPSSTPASVAASSAPASAAESSAPASVAASSTPASVAASSTPASDAASSAPASVASSSTPASSAPAAPTVINAGMTTGWRGNGTGNSGVTYIADGVSFNASANEIGAVFDVDPVNLQNAVLEMVLNVSPEFKASGANLQPFAQVKEVWGGKWCDISNSALVASEDYVATCTLDESVLNQTVNGLQVGVQASGTPTGVVTIKSAKLTLATQATTSSVASSSSSAEASSSSSSSSSAAPSGIVADVTQGWEVANGGGTVSYTANGVLYTAAAPAQYSSGVYFTTPGPVNLEGATLTLSITPDAAFKASGQNPQPFAQLGGGSYAGEWDCWFNNTDLVVGASNTLTCTISQAGVFNVADTTPVRLGFQLANGTSYAGSVTITAASVVLAH